MIKNKKTDLISYPKNKIKSFKKQCKKWDIYNKDNDNSSEIVCDICLDSDTSVSNQDILLQCDGCNAATHQGCYGYNKFKTDVNDYDEAWLC